MVVVIVKVSNVAGICCNISTVFVSIMLVSILGLQAMHHTCGWQVIPAGTSGVVVGPARDSQFQRLLVRFALHGHEHVAPWLQAFKADFSEFRPYT